MNQRKLELIVGSLALFGLLAYTFVHTGALLARWVRPEWVGYAAAFGVELSIVWMSIRIGANRKAGKQTGWLVFVLSVTLFISAVANVAEGFEAFVGEPLTMTNLGRIDWIQGVVGVFATAFICLVVFALSEVIGTDVDQAIKRAKRDERKSEPSESMSVVVETQAEPAPNSYQSQVFALLQSGEQMTQAQIAAQTGASKATVSKWARAFEGEHRENGSGKGQ
jgi:DNA-binding transcriptional regulator YiaG